MTLGQFFLSFIKNDVARKIGLPGDSVNINLNAKEISFQLISMNKSSVSKPMYAVTMPSVGNPFNRVNFNPERHAYLVGLKFADKYPSTWEREFEMIVSEPYFSELKRAEEVKSPNPSLPMAKLTALGWILRGAFGVSRQLITASAFGVHANENETFDLQTIYESLSFDFAKFWSRENIGISKTEAKPTNLTALEIRAEEHHRKTAKFNIKKKKWTVL